MNIQLYTTNTLYPILQYSNTSPQHNNISNNKKNNSLVYIIFTIHMYL